jgi:hypothetical protein
MLVNSQKARNQPKIKQIFYDSPKDASSRGISKGKQIFNLSELLEIFMCVHVSEKFSYKGANPIISSASILFHFFFAYFYKGGAN